MSQEHAHGDPGELAAWYVAGGMSDDQRVAFESHLKAGCTECVAALETWDGVVHAVFSAIEPLAPDAALLGRLLEKTGEPGAAGAVELVANHKTARQAKPPAEPLDLFVLRADEGAWQDAGVEGIQIRMLYRDHEQRRYTALVRMEPHAVYAEHTHQDAEECFVLEGDLRVGDLLLRQGDYQRTPAGFQQAAQTTEHGCLLLLSTPLE